MKICADCGKELPEDYEEEQTRKEKESDRLFPVRYERFFYS
jgi:hypothetical protein